MKSFSAILPVVAAVIESIAMLIIAESSAMAVTYPPPFPNTVIAYSDLATTRQVHFTRALTICR